MTPFLFGIALILVMFWALFAYLCASISRREALAILGAAALVTGTSWLAAFLLSRDLIL